jgi:hypothetical protein
VVCDVQLDVFSHRAIEVSLSPPATRSWSSYPRQYMLQISTSSQFDEWQTRSLDVTLSGDSSKLATPVIFVDGLIEGRAYYVRIAVPPALYSIEGVSLPVDLQPLFTTAGIVVLEWSCAACRVAVVWIDN